MRNVIFLFFAFLLPVQSIASVKWPSLNQAPAVVGGGAQDAAVIVGIEGYFAVPPVPGARANAVAWYDYLTTARKVPPENVFLLRDSDGTVEEMEEAAAKAAVLAGPEGKLWFIFIGHGAPHKNGKDGLLIGADAQQKASSIQNRSLGQTKLLNILGRSKAQSINVVLDACFSGRSTAGTPLVAGLQPLITTRLSPATDPRFVVMTAAMGNQFAGPLPGVSRPAFSYLILGGLRGWADSNADGDVTAGEAIDYSKRALRATMHGRDQTPTLMGPESASLGPSSKEKAPSLTSLAKREHKGMFQVSKLPSVPNVRMPQAFQKVPGSGSDWRNMDVDALEAYDKAIKLDQSQSDASLKAAQWRKLLKDHPVYSKEAEGRAQDWDRYAAEQAAAKKALDERNAVRDKDWKKLNRLLALSVVSVEDKARWSMMFLEAYGRSPKDNPYAKQLGKHTAVIEKERKKKTEAFKDRLRAEVWRRNFNIGVAEGKKFENMSAEEYQRRKPDVTRMITNHYIKQGALVPSQNGSVFTYTTGKGETVTVSISAEDAVRKIADLVLRDVKPLESPIPPAAKEFHEKLEYELFRRYFNLLLLEKNEKAVSYVTAANYEKENPSAALSLAKNSITRKKGRIEYKVNGHEAHYTAPDQSIVITLPKYFTADADKELTYTRGVDKIADLINANVLPRRIDKLKDDLLVEIERRQTKRAKAGKKVKRTREQMFNKGRIIRKGDDFFFKKGFKKVEIILPPDSTENIYKREVKKLADVLIKDSR